MKRNRDKGETYRVVDYNDNGLVIISEYDAPPPPVKQFTITDLDGSAVFTGRARELRELQLSNSRLVRADLRGADLHCAYLVGADLSGADLSGADLSGANLDFARLDGAKFSRANLNNAYLRHVDLRHVDLDGCNLLGANVTGSDGIEKLHGSGAYVSVRKSVPWTGSSRVETFSV